MANGDDVTFTAGEQICLEAGFEVELGGEFLAQIGAKSVRDYVGNLEYFNGELEAIYHENGRVVKRANGWEFQYLIADHLGNTRVLFKDNGSGIAEVLGKWSYYPYGLVHEGIGNEADNPKMNYKYANKEHQTDLGLNLTDFGNRCQDPALGRFTTIDRFAEKYYSLSSYGYTAGNPIKFIDVNGDSINVSNLNANDPNAWNKIKSDLEDFTGLSLSVDDKGNLDYTKPEGKLEGSKRARKKLIKAIEDKETVYVENDEGGTGSHVPMEAKSKDLKNTIYINSEQLQGFVDGTSPDLDNRTYGFGMNFLHELGHTRVGGRKYDGGHATPGANVASVNKIRRQLGPKFGQRIVYAQFRPTGSPGYEYFPFSRASHKSLLQNKVPSSGFIKILIK